MKDTYPFQAHPESINQCYGPKLVDPGTPNNDLATLNEVHRVLEVGRILFSVLTESEIEELKFLIEHREDLIAVPLVEMEIGNTGVT